MGIETIAALGLAAAGSGLEAYGAAKDAKIARKRQNALTNQANSMMQTAPGDAEKGLMGFFNTIGGNSAVNTGQDALMQMLRADPSKQRSYVDDTIRGIATQADPFAPGGAYSAMEAANQRANATQVAQLRAGASTLGQRFGSGLMTAEARLRGDQSAQGAANRASLAQQFQQLRLNAAGMGSQRELALGDQRINAAGQLNQSGSNQLAMMLQALQSAGQLGQARNAYNASLFGATAGMPTAGSGLGQVGSSIGDFGQLLYLMSHLNSPAKKAA